MEAGNTGDEADEVFHLDMFDTVIGQEGDDVDSDEEEEEDDEGGLSDLSSEAGSDSDESAKDEQMDAKHIQEMVSKLDSILEVIFKHLDRLHSAISDPIPDSTNPSSSTGSSPALVENGKAGNAGSPISDSKRAALAEARFHSLLSIFERTILRTFKSRYTQFLVFWYSSIDMQFRDRFLGAIVSTALLEPAQSIVTRAAAASYAASYVSRASFVARDETQMVVRVLCQFLQTHLDEFDEYAKQHAMSPRNSYSQLPVQQSAEQRAVFYAVAQAVFLIFCFRWRDLTLHDENEVVYDEFGDTSGNAVHRAWMSELNVMQRVINSALNPLKVFFTAVLLCGAYTDECKYRCARPMWFSNSHASRNA